MVLQNINLVGCEITPPEYTLFGSVHSYILHEPSVLCCNMLFTLILVYVVDLSAFPAIADVIADENAVPVNSSLTCVVVYMFGAELSPVKMVVCEISKILQILSF